MFSSSRSKAYLALLLNTVIWGAALPLVKPALSFISPFNYLWLRYLLALVPSLPLFLYLYSKHRPHPKDLLIIAILESAILVLGHSLLYLGLATTSALEASLIGNTSPIFIAIAGVIILKEKLEPHELFGSLLAVVGVLILTILPILNGPFTTSQSLVGNSLVLSYVLLWTAYNIVGKALYPKIPKLLIVSFGLVVATPLMWLTSSLISGLSPITVLTDSLSALSHWQVLIAVFYMAIPGTLIAIPAYIYGLSRIEASEASLFTYLQPLVYIPLAIFWLSETVIPSQLIGLLLIALGVIIAEWRKRTRSHHHKRRFAKLTTS